MIIGAQNFGGALTKRGKVVKGDLTQQANGEKIENVEGYKYRGILKIDEILKQSIQEIL